MTIDFEKHLRETQRLTHIGSWEWDIASDILTWTEEHYRIFGLTPEKFSPTFRGAVRYIHPDDAPRVEEALTRCITDGAAVACEWRLLRADGTERTVFTRGARIGGAGRNTATLYGVLQDITERKHAQDALFQLERYLNLEQDTPHRERPEFHAALSLRSGASVPLGTSFGLPGAAAAIILVATDLSPQERRALALVAQGKTNKEIAAQMKLSPKTVKNYLSRVFQKLQVAGRAEAVSRVLGGA